MPLTLSQKMSAALHWHHHKTSLQVAKVAGSGQEGRMYISPIHGSVEMPLAKCASNDDAQVAVCSNESAHSLREFQQSRP